MVSQSPLEAPKEVIEPEVDHAKCRICNEQVPIYRCSGCPVKYCSLLCFKSHKPHCTQEKRVEKYVSMKDYNHNNLLRDFDYLSDMLNKAS